MPVTISPTNSRLTFANKPQAPANGSKVIAVKVRVYDTNNQPAASRVVEIYSDDEMPAGVLLAQPIPTDEDGLTFGFIKSSVVGPITLRARVLPDVGETGNVIISSAVTANFYAPDLDDTTPPPVSDRRVHLTWSVSRYIAHNVDGVRVRIEADSSNLMPTKIFAYQMLPFKPGEFEQVGAFDHVCSAVDLEEYPEDAPLPNIRPQWFRLNYVDVLLRSREEVRAFINSVLEDVSILKNTLDTTEILAPDGDVWIGSPPQE